MSNSIETACVESTVCVESTERESTYLPAETSERARAPYAVGVRYETEPLSTYELFVDKDAAALFASIMDELSGDLGLASVTRFVAVDGAEWQPSTPVWGWRQVSKFVL